MALGTLKTTGSLPDCTFPSHKPQLVPSSGFLDLPLFPPVFLWGRASVSLTAFCLLVVIPPALKLYMFFMHFQFESELLRVGTESLLRP